MTPEQRKALAEQILSNPLFAEIMDEMEGSAVRRLIHAHEQEFVRAQERVRAIQTLRQDLDICLNTLPTKGAVA